MALLGYPGTTKLSIAVDLGDDPGKRLQEPEQGRMVPSPQEVRKRWEGPKRNKSNKTRPAHWSHRKDLASTRYNAVTVEIHRLEGRQTWQRPGGWKKKNGDG